MRFHGLAGEVFGSPVRTSVLSLFLKFPAKRFSGREVARLCGVSPMAAWQAVGFFEAQGLVSRSKVGASHVLELNGKHFLAKKLVFLADFDDVALGELKRVLMESLPMRCILRAYLYGSVARKEERPTSDIDVLVVVKSQGDKKPVAAAAGDAALKVVDLFGNPLSVLAFTEAEFKRDVNLFKEVKKEGVVLFEKRS